MKTFVKPLRWRCGVWALVPVLLVLIASKVQAGWAGGGGELLKDVNNPWFLDNTPVVSYCVEQGHDFSLDAVQANQLIGKALKAWKRELAAVEDTAQPIFGARVRVGTQDFRPIRCDGSEDLKFQLGTLDAAQKAYFGEYRRYVGAAIRTDYKEDRLVGRGFVFLASDLGPNRYEGLAPDGFWSREEGLAFYRVLVHELGHVFGVPHLDLLSSPIGVGPSVMDSDGPEKIVAGAQAVWPFDTDAPLSILQPISSTPPTLCKTAGNLSWPLRRFLEVPVEYECIKIEKRGDNRFAVLIQRDLNTSGGQFVEHGSIQLTEPPEREYRPIITVKITPLQTVYDISGPVFEILKYLPGPGLVQVRTSGVFKVNSSAIEKPISLAQGFSGGLELTGILDDKINFNLFSLPD